MKKDRELFLTKAEESGMGGALDEAVSAWLSDEKDFYTLLGFILGLRIAGIPSETAKAMARTWRLGLPQDDTKGGRR